MLDKLSYGGVMMMGKCTFAALAAGLALAGCATPYQDMGFMGGVRATQISADEAQITARGNGYTDPDTIQRYVLRKAAETTVAAGFDTFAVMNDADRSRSGEISTGSATAYGNSAYAVGYSTRIFKPGETVLIKMMHGPKPADAPGNVFDAHDLLKYLTPPAK